MNLSAQLKKYRKKSNLTQNELAEYLNVSRQSVSKWETGKSYPDLDTLLTISKLYKIPINKLMEDETDHKSDIPDESGAPVKRKAFKFDIKDYHILFFISIMLLFLIPIGGLIAPFILAKNKKGTALYSSISFVCVICILLSIIKVFVMLFF
ncbi:helix-turn-helix transcriptional regulator [bacterium 210820-DFI.6.37]|nr:helix-turn-helix transcriptional regulator [bacterium 210820-DFI.6.37]